MKISNSLNPPSFTPVTLNFTFETQDELDKWGSLFNSAKFISILKNLEMIGVNDRLHEAFRENKSNIDKFVHIINSEIKVEFNR